jgi:hypothetical protein
MSQENTHFDKLVQVATVGGTVYIAGIGAGMLIPAAMASFGTIVPGVGTLHAAGGIASLLQSAAANAVSNSIVAGAVSVPVLYIRSKL